MKMAKDVGRDKNDCSNSVRSIYIDFGQKIASLLRACHGVERKCAELTITMRIQTHADGTQKPLAWIRPSLVVLIRSAVWQCETRATGRPTERQLCAHTDPLAMCNSTGAGLHFFGRFRCNIYAVGWFRSAPLTTFRINCSLFARWSLPFQLDCYGVVRRLGSSEG